MIVDRVGAGEPDAVGVLVVHDVGQDIAQPGEPVWLADHEAMQREGEDQR